MANRGEARFQQGVIEAMTDHGWKAGTTFGYDRKGEGVSELELSRYHLTKCEEKHLRQEEAEGDHDTPVSEVGSGKTQNPEKQRFAEIIDCLHNLYDAQFYFSNGIADRIERDEAVMAPVRNHSETRRCAASSRRRSQAPCSISSASMRSSACRC